MGSKSLDKDGGNPAKIFVGGLHRDTSMATFTKHFGKYGEIVDSVIMKDKQTNHPRGFGFITYANPSVVDQVIEENHIIHGKQVEIKRTIPKGSVPADSKDFKTKKIFVGGIPTTVADDEFRNFFSKYGHVVDHQIMRDRESNRSRGFGFIVFESEEVVDALLERGKMINFAGSEVEIKRAEPKKPSKPAPSTYGKSKSRPVTGETKSHSFVGEFDGYTSTYNGPTDVLGPQKSSWEVSSRFTSSFSSYGSGDYGGYPGELGLYRGSSAYGYPGRLGSLGSLGMSFGAYGSGLGGTYGSGLGGAYGGYERANEGFGDYGASYGSSLRSSYGRAGEMYDNKGSSTSGGVNRYHPYGR